MIVNLISLCQISFKRLLSIFCLIIVVIYISACTLSRPKGVTCEITSHTDDSEVERYITIKGTVDGLGSRQSLWSYARVKQTGEPWWLSDKKATVIGIEWGVDVVIGNEETTSGFEFEVVIVAANRKPQDPMTDDLPNSVTVCESVSLIKE